MIDPAAIDLNAVYWLSGEALKELIEGRGKDGAAAPGVAGPVKVTGVQGQIAVQVKPGGEFSIGFASEKKVFIIQAGGPVAMLIPMRQVAA